MGKKRTKQQSFNGVIAGDSSESDVSLNKGGIQNASRICPHASKSVDHSQIRKNLNSKDLNDKFCQQCPKHGQSIEGEETFVCLRCGAKSCSLNHSKEHYSVPRSNSHALSVNLSNLTVWCHVCGHEIDVSTNKKLNVCVNNVDNIREKFLRAPPSSPKIGTITEEPEANNKLEAIPLLPPKTRIVNGASTGVKGLRNLGNTCFFNSVLQCLAQTPNLVETLKEMEDSDKEVCIELKGGRKLEGNIEKWDNLCEALAETLMDIKKGGNTLSPSKLLNLLKKKVPQFRGSDQHDAHELLRHLLDLVRCSDLKRYRRIMLIALGLNGVDAETVNIEKQKELKLLDREVTEKIMLVPDQVFRGFLVSRLQCQECDHSSECVESFLDLSLPVSSEKPVPPSVRRKGYSNGSPEEKGGSQMSKHQLKKERKLVRKKNRKHHGPHNKKDHSQEQEEGLPSISEKGDTDGEGDDGDVDSECSGDKKTENHQTDGTLCNDDTTHTAYRAKFVTTKHESDEDYEDSQLCAGIPSPKVYLTRQRTKLLASKLRFEGIHLLEDGTPDISKFNINDSSQPNLKMHIRDSATIAKEEPSWHSQLSELPESQNISESLNDFANDQSSNISESVDEPERVLNGVKEEDLSADDKDKDPWNEDRVPDEIDINKSDIHDELVKEENDVQETMSDEETMVGSLFDENSCVDSGGECSVQTCLSQFTGIELMTGSNKVGCETCTERANKGDKDGKTVYTMSTKRLLIAQAPPVLILHIKRFQVQMSSYRKLSRHVAFPLELDISSFCKVEAVKSKKLVYTLYGIVEHRGNSNGGHYVAYVKVENSQWFCVSDAYVNEVPETKILQAQAYLLFYKLS